MAWQGLFIVWLVTVHSDYYITEVYVLRDAIEGIVGYLLLAAMTATSFMPIRKRMKPGNWKLLHKIGIYFLWAYAFSVYWWNLFYYASPVLLDYVYYWGGFVACGLRIAAWRKQRRTQSEKHAPESDAAQTLTIPGYVLIGIGLLVAAFGSAWRPMAEAILYGYTITRWPELYLPYWPFEPFLALFVITLGAYLTTGVRGTAAPQPAA